MLAAGVGIRRTVGTVKAGVGIPRLVNSADICRADMPAPFNAARTGASCRALCIASAMPSPTEVEAVRAVIRGIRRTIGTVKAPKAPATNDLLLAMVGFGWCSNAQE